MYKVEFTVCRPRRQRGCAISYLIKACGSEESAMVAYKRGWVESSNLRAAIELAREMETVRDMMVSQYVFNCAVWQSHDHREQQHD